MVINEIKTTPVTKQYDVLVCGGGFAGISAALAAARLGKKVALLEREFMLGGLGTAGLIAIYLPLCDGYGRQVSFGIAEELLRLSVSMGYEERPQGPRGYFNWVVSDDPAKRTEKDPRFEVQYNPQVCAILMEQALLKAGVKILYGTYTGGGFPAGTYRLHATKYDGEKYVSVAWCEFTVGEGEADTSAPTNSSKLPFTIMLDQSIYTTRDTVLSIRFRANEPGVPLSRSNCWSIYRMENGERIHLVSQTAEYAFEGEEVAPNEYAEEQYALSIRTATGGNCDTLPVGEYELVFDGDGSTFSFEVLELPEDTVTRFAYYLSSGLLILEGTNNATDPFSAEGYPVDYEGLTDGDRVEIRMADFILETWPCQIKVYAVRKVTDGTIDNIPADLLAQLKEYVRLEEDE